MSAKKVNMSLSIADCPNIYERAKELGLREPHDIAFLPRNFFSAEDCHQLAYGGSVSMLERLFSEEGLPAMRLDSEGRKKSLFVRNTLGLVVPVVPIVFIAACVHAQHPELVNIACGVLANYITKFLQPGEGEAPAKVTFVVETTKTKQIKRLSYEGPVEGITKLPKELWAVANEVSA